ncbi:MAG: fibronectin type III domain-containing protein, partial [Elusimicrobiaceae bacterium]
MFRFLIKKLCRPDIISAPLMAALFFCASVSAMVPPAGGELEKYVQDGSFARRAEFANALGNNRAAPRQLSKMSVSLSKNTVESAPPPALRGVPTSGNVRPVVLLIDFIDATHTISSAAVANGLFGTSGGAYGSLRNYYYNSSYGKLELSGGLVLGWQKLLMRRSSVAGTKAERENIIKTALANYAGSVDFSQYDSDGDGYVDDLIVVWSGDNGGWGDFWWSYTDTIVDASFTYNGVKFRNYSWQWEKYGTAQFDVMTATRLMANSLGIPDYYDYAPGVGPNGGLGGIDIMDSLITHTPRVDHNAFSKMLLGWLEPQAFNSGSSAVSLGSVETSSSAAQLLPAGGVSSVFGEYFLIENRQNGTGNDLDLPGSGLLIWHVNAALNTAGSDFLNDNSRTDQKLLKLMQADGQGHIEQSLYAQANDFYKVGGHFGAGTNPNSSLYSGLPTSADVSAISGANPMAFTVAYSAPPGEIANLSAAEVTGTIGSVRLDWTQPANASRYEIRYSTIGEPGGSAVPWDSAQVWTSTKTASSVTETEYAGALYLPETFYFKVKAYNADGSFVFSNAASVRPWDAPPSAPDSVYADDQIKTENGLGGDGMAYINWTAPGEDGDYGDIKLGAYRFAVSTDPAVSWDVDVYNDSGTIHDIVPGDNYAFAYNGLMPDVTYYLALWIQDEGGNWSLPAVENMGYFKDYVPAVPVLTGEPMNRAIKFSWALKEADIDYCALWISTYAPFFVQNSSGNINQLLISSISMPTSSYIGTVPAGAGGNYRLYCYDNKPDGAPDVPYVKYSTSNVLQIYATDLEAPLVRNLRSTTHPSEDVVYANNLPQFFWDASDTGGQGLQNIFVSLSATSTLTADQVGQFTLGPNISSYTYTAPLTEGDWYFYVVAQDKAGNKSEAVKRKIRVDWYPNQPGTPSIAVASGKLTITWTPPSPVPADLDYYELYCDSVTADDWSDSFLLARSTGTSFIHDNLDVLTTYYYRVVAVDKGPLVLKSSPTLDAMARPLGVVEIGSINSPTHPSHTAWSGNNLPSFSWTVNDMDRNGIASYYLLLSTSEVTGSVLMSTGIAQTFSTYTAPSPIADGEWAFYLMARDNLGNLTSVAKYAFLVDASTPVAPAGLSAAQEQNSILVSWTTPAMAYDISYYKLFCDSTTPYDFSDAFEVASVTTTYYLHTGLENNQPYLYRLYAVDRQGHRSDYSGILNTYPIDATGPVISSVTSPTHPVADLWYPSPSPTFSWSASDSGGAGIKGYYYLLNQLVDVTTEVIKAQGFYTSDTSVSLSGLTDGLWYFHIFAEDQQGNQSRLVSRETRIDYAPGAPRNLNLVARERKITLLWDPPEFVPSDLEKYRIYCDSVSPYGFSEGFILAQTTSTRFEHLNLDSSSTYYYWVTALDTAPNILESEFSNGVAGRPVNSIAIYNVVSPTHPSTSTWYANALPEFSWQVEGNGGLGVSAYYVAVTTYSVSSAAVLAEGVKLTTTSYTVPTALADGAWRFQVISEDALNDHSDMVVYPFKVDAASPPAPLHLLAVSSQNAISLTWDAPVFTYDVDRYEVFCDSVSPFDFSDAFLVVTTTETNYLHTGLINNKSYHYRVYAVDGTGHVGNYADTANNAPLDIISPTVSGLASSSHPDRTFWYQDDSPQFAWSASDGGGSGINGYYYAYSDAETMARQVLLATGVFTSSSGVALSGVPDGFWYFHVMAVDNQGNMSEVNSLPFRIDYFPAPPANVALEKWNGQIKVSWTAPDPDPGDIAFYRVYCDSTTPYDWEDSFILAQVSTFSYMHVDLNEHNTYYYRVTAVDNDPNILESVYSDAVSGVPVDATPPVVTALDSPSHPFENVWYQNSSATFTWGATDSGGAGFKGYYYLLNQSSSVTTGGLLAAGEFTYSTSTSYAGPLADGSWYMHVLGVDNFNNAGSVRNRRININFPPTAPRNLVMSTDVTHVTLTWDPPDPALTDFGYYKVFCDSSTPYDWGDAYLATSTVDAVFIDTVTTYSTRRYRVSVVDSQPTPLESGYSNDIMLEGTSASVNVISPTHPSHTVWSGNNTPSFNWTVSGFDGSSASNYYLMLSTRTVLQAELLASGIAQTESTYTVTVPLADGEWGLYIIARDNLQRFTAVAKYVFLVDVSTPVVPAGFSATQAQNSILLSWDEPYKTYDVAYYRLFCDSTTPYDFADAFEVADTTATSYLHTGLSNYQPYAYRFYVVDRNNNRSDFSGILNTYPVDALLPVISSVTSVTHPVPGVWYPNPSPAYSWTANDGGGAGLKGYYYILNQRVEMTAAEIKAQGVYTSDTEVSYSDLVDGVWYFHLIAEDQQGNQSLPFRYETRIDYAPGAPRNLNLAARNNKIILLWEPPAVVPPDFDVYRIYCDSTSPYNFVDGFILAQTTSTRFDHVNLSSSATYAYQLTGLDVAPNILESGFSNIMSARPISSIAISSIASPTHPSSSTWYAGALPSFSWQVEGNGGIGVSSYYVYLSTFAVSSGTVLASGVKLTTTSYTVPAALADGEWLFQVLSEDVLNDHSPLAVYPFKIDRSSPPAPPHLLAVSSQNAVSLSWDIPVFTYDVDHYEVFCDSVSPYDFSDAFLVVNTTSTNYIHTDLVNYRPYHYRVFAVDKNGRRGSFADTANNAPIDITPPVISGLVSDSHPDPDFWYQDNSPRFNWFARDDGGSGINGYYYVYNTQSQMTAQEIIYAGVFTSSAGVVLSGVPDGFWYFHVMTVDNQGNMSAALDKPFRVDYFPAPPENVTLEKWNGQIKISWTAPDPNPGDIDIYRVYCDSSTPHDWNNSFIVAQTSTLSFTHNDLNVHNTYYYRVTVVDAGPNVLESTYSASVSGLPLDSIAPVMVSLDSPSHPFAASWYENNRPTFTWVATDAGGSGLKGFYYQLNQLEFMTTGQLLLDGDFIYANTTNYSAPVADGVWYAHVMPADYQSNIGNML